jgi:hypothetical protein
MTELDLHQRLWVEWAKSTVRTDYQTWLERRIAELEEENRLLQDACFEKLATILTQLPPLEEHEP